MYKKLYEWLDQACGRLDFNSKLQAMFRRCFLSTLETTVRRSNGGTFVITGDIPAMWLRDSSVQVSHYLELAGVDPDVKSLIAELLQKQFYFIKRDAYANAFNERDNGDGHKDIFAQSPIVWERKYELDSLIYPLWLLCGYCEAVKDRSILDDDFYKTLDIVLVLLRTEQNHDTESAYRFSRSNENDTLKNGGKGVESAYTGMTWSGFRPSDDVCTYHYLIPANMFAVATFKRLEQIVERAQYKDSIKALRRQIQEGIDRFGVVSHEKFGLVYAYETDGLGNYNLMDDANVPNLLSLPYLGYCGREDALYQNTRSFVLSQSNPYYFCGKYACGVGSPHTPKDYIWHISLIMQALTSGSKKEIAGIFHTLLTTDDGTDYMHEGFCCNDPSQYTRPWFAWANTLFAVLVIRHLEHIKDFF